MKTNPSAAAILLQAKETLESRLNRMVLDGQSGLLEDAAGTSYMNEVGSLYEEVGTKLTQINVLLSHLPSSGEDLGGPQGTSTGPGAPTFKEFAQRVGSGDLAGASPQLEELLGLDPGTAERCTQIYAERLREYPETIERTLQLRDKIREGNRDGALLILLECFALSGTQAFQALDRLWSRFAA